jgi:hypothetical protein
MVRKIERTAPTKSIAQMLSPLRYDWMSAWRRRQSLGRNSPTQSSRTRRHGAAATQLSWPTFWSWWVVCQGRQKRSWSYQYGSSSCQGNHEQGPTCKRPSGMCTDTSCSSGGRSDHRCRSGPAGSRSGTARAGVGRLRPGQW